MTTGCGDHRQVTAPEPPGLDPLIHSPVRLRICAALSGTDEAEFGWLLDVLEVTKSALSKHTGALLDAGYLARCRAVRDGRQRVWLRLTRDGRTAYEMHVAALRAIVDTGSASPPPTGAVASDDQGPGGVSDRGRGSSPPAPHSRPAPRSG